MRLLLGLSPPQETPARTPWWLLALRLAAAALVILGLAQPLLNPAATLTGSGPLLLIVDDGGQLVGALNVHDLFRAGVM